MGRDEAKQTMALAPSSAQNEWDFATRDRLAQHFPSRSACVPLSALATAGNMVTANSHTRTGTVQPNEDESQLQHGSLYEGMRGWRAGRDMQGVNKTACDSPIVKSFPGSLLCLQVHRPS